MGIRRLMPTRRRRRLAPVPPVMERVMRALAYLALGMGGVYGHLGHLPRSLGSAITDSQLSIWVAFMSMSFIAMYGAVSGRYRIEYIAIPFIVAGVAIYGAAMAWFVFSGTNPGSGLGLSLALAVVGSQCARWFSLNQLIYGGLASSLKRLIFWRRNRDWMGDS